MKIMVAGGAGFIGSNFIHYWLDQHPQDSVLNYDLLTPAGRRENLDDLSQDSRYIFEQGDIADAERVDQVMTRFRPEILVNFAAESHNSLAILNPTRFFETNLMGVQTLLEATRKHKLERFHHVSTCEVYGDLALDDPGAFSEESPLRPNTPYNASKAAADLAIRAYVKTFGSPVSVSNCANNYGPYQLPEKLIPLFITRLLRQQQVPLYRSSQNKREWIHVRDHCRAIELILQRGQAGDYFNVGTGVELSVEEITTHLLTQLGQDESMKKYVPDRPSHDRRYLLNSDKIRRELGWAPEIDFGQGIAETVQWYRDNAPWWQPIVKELEAQRPDVNWGEYHRESEHKSGSS